MYHHIRLYKIAIRLSGESQSPEKLIAMKYCSLGILSSFDCNIYKEIFINYTALDSCVRRNIHAVDCTTHNKNIIISFPPPPLIPPRKRGGEVECYFQGNDKRYATYFPQQFGANNPDWSVWLIINNWRHWDDNLTETLIIPLQIPISKSCESA